MRINVWIALAIVLLTQTGVLGWMVYDRQRVLRDGREIVLKTEPIDPRSLFRGDYVVLSYPITRLPVTPPEELTPNELRYVTLEEKQPGDWAFVAVSKTLPSSLGTNQVMLAGRIVDVWRGGPQEQMQLRFGIESYFVPEGEGKVLEDKVRTGELKVVVAVDQRGKAAIKGLVLDGNVRYDEPLF
jgi:uncharacterized membrane-anchored protein